MKTADGCSFITRQLNSFTAVQYVYSTAPVSENTCIAWILSIIKPQMLRVFLSYLNKDTKLKSEI